MARQFTAEERRRILAEARETVRTTDAFLANARRNARKPAADPPPVRSDPPIVYKTYEPAAAPVTAAASWANWVDNRIATAIAGCQELMEEAIGEVFAIERDRYDKMFKELERALVVVREEVGIEKKLLRLRRNVDDAIARQPHYEGELRELRDELTKTREQLLKARSTITALEYGISQLEKQQTRAKVEHSRTVITTENIGDATRRVLAEVLEESGAEDISDLVPLGHG